MNTRSVSLIFLFALLAIPPVFADQTNPELNKLFSDLKTAQNPDNAKFIAEQIWATWQESEDQNINELMSQGLQELIIGNLTYARDTFKEITNRFPNFAEGWNRLATVNYMMGEIDASLSNIEETLKLEPRHFGAISGRGLCYLKLKRWQSALIEFKSALDLHPWLPDARRNLKLLEDNLKNHSI